VLHAACLIGLFTVMYFKRRPPNRPRPSQLCPALLPPIQVPSHASYPSGHATQATLIAECAKLVLPASGWDGLKHDLDVLARRIGRNREIGGLHYPSDSDAGRTLAAGILAIMRDASIMPRFDRDLGKARAEWT
jgi:membrane-associated phospholipid phosphatase